MRKRRFRLMSLLLCMALFFSMNAYAMESRASSYIISRRASLSVKRNGDLCIQFFTHSNGTMDILGASEIVIERYSGVRWVEEYTYTPRNTPEIQANDTNYYSTTLTYTPDYTGSDYRAVVTFYAEDADGSDSKSEVTQTVTT